MSDVFELNLAGLNELMKSAEMQSALDEAGAAVARSAGGDYGTRTHVASFTAICNVYPSSKAAADENRKENALIKAIASAGLHM